jgi:hypothetical protein
VWRAAKWRACPSGWSWPGRLGPSTFSVRTGDRLLFFTDRLLEARDSVGRFFQVDQQIQALSRPDPQAAVDELMDRLRAHTRRRLDDDVAVLLVELTLTNPRLQPVPPGQRTVAGLARDG